MPTGDHIPKFQRGKRLQFSRRVRLRADAMTIVWTDVPHSLVRTGHESVTLFSPGADNVQERELRASGAGRVMGAAASPAADMVVIANESETDQRRRRSRFDWFRKREAPPGIRLATFDSDGLRRAIEYPDKHSDIGILTTANMIVVPCRHPKPRLLSFDWKLEQRREWSLEPLQTRFGDPCDHISVTQNLGDALLLGTGRTWSRWTWEGELLEAWPMPCLGLNYGVILTPTLVSWHARFPLLLMPDSTVVEWDLSRAAAARSFGAAKRWPVGARSPDGRWLVLERITSPEGRGIELWDLRDGTLVERLETRHQGVNALAFSPNGDELAVAAREFFTMRISNA